MSASDANSRSFTEARASAATHVITHNLKSRWVTYAAFFTADGVQLQPGTEIDLVTAVNENVLRIELSSPAAITVRITT